MRLLVASLTFLAWAVDALTAAAAPRPNILLVLSDDHSAAHVGCYGNNDIRTPHFDKFAAQGIRFDRAYVACPQCVPSRASIMTGRAPIDINMTRFTAPLPRSVKTYPEALRAAGWFTGVCGRTYHLDGAPTSPESRAVLEQYKLQTFADRLDYVRSGTQEQGFAQMQEFLDLAKDRPWFLQLCFNDPHRPLADNSYSQSYDPARLSLPAHYPDTKLVREDLARYYGEITRADELFGRIMVELDRRGLADNTLVAFMGDNGCSQFRGKGTLYELGIHVPLVMRWPGKIRPGSTASELVSGEDLAPTFLEAAGVPIPAEMTGQSCAQLLCGKPFQGRKYVFAERGAHGSSLPQNTAGFDLARVVVSPTHKLIYNVLWQLPYTPVDFSGDAMWKELQTLNAEGKLSPELSQRYFAPARPMFELYDLQADPSELSNLAGKPSATAVEKELKAALQEWMILQRDFAPLPVAPTEKAGKGWRHK